MVPDTYFVENGTGHLFRATYMILGASLERFLRAASMAALLAAAVMAKNFRREQRNQQLRPCRVSGTSFWAMDEPQGTTGQISP
jgi:hypothetical protein